MIVVLKLNIIKDFTNIVKDKILIMSLVNIASTVSFNRSLILMLLKVKVGEYQIKMTTD